MQLCTYTRRYRGPVKAVVLDWAGTIADHGSRAPAFTFVEVFARQGVEITIAEARTPMGAEKREHIRAITRMPAVAARWEAKHGTPPGEEAVEAMYVAFVPLQIEAIRRCGDLIPGALECAAELREREVLIGSSTGYSSEMLAVVLEEARERGFEPDAAVCASDVPAGRPAPWMALEVARRLEVYPLEACVKVDDTPVGIEAGLNAGMWTVAVVRTGNELGLLEAEIEALPDEEYLRRIDAACGRMQRAGAHYVVDGIADLAPCLEDIEERLGRGERP